MIFPEDTTYNNFSKILGERMLKIGDVHKATGISKNTLVLIFYQRKKDYRYTTLAKICNYLEISIEDFFKKEEANHQ
ncbi:helix-turn-helix domain-containing protein [Enterococcus faecalis]|uniref:helix-turn-helix domain-containing protein n=1 Tax=Enterococcus faecalis TaxID=1351 RepID=UPI000353DED3|nr:helix-turn-helix transcriptional regulator [Enterococcus faecalis]EPI39928.1 toxin-antitoxin system, antitoxin component, Xre family [Enterococcus faecalis LA3B-2]